MLQTPVSSDGTTLKRRGLAAVWARPTVSRPDRQAKLGALSPAFSCGPTSVTGPPLNVTAFGRFCMVNVLSKRGKRERCGQDRDGPRQRQTAFPDVAVVRAAR